MLANSDVPDPLALWDAARKQLDDAIQLYLDTSIALAGAFSQPWNTFPHENPFDAAVNNIHHDIRSSRVEHLDSAQAYLCKLRNSSTKLIPLNKLPLEIIIRIFHFAAGRSCACDAPSAIYPVQEYGPKTLLALTHVCTYWRDIAVNRPSLWSHVTFDLKRKDNITVSNLPRLWLERARNIPLFIHLDGEQPPLTNQMGTAPLANLLFPYLNNITGFCTENGWRSMIGNLLYTLSEKWKANLAQDSAGLGEVDRSGSQALKPAPSQSAESPLPSLRILRLQSLYIPDVLAMYNNLVDLRFGGLYHLSVISLDRFLVVLSACPGLRALSLRQIFFRQQKVAYLERVVLSALELLDVSEMDPNALSILLPRLSLGRAELGVKVRCQRQGAVGINAITSLFSRSNVTKLFLDGINPACVSTYLSFAPGLRVLILDLGSKRSDECLEGITYLTHPDAGRRSARCSKLQSLYLINGSLSNSTVQVAVEAHSLQKLTFGACFLDPFEEELVHWLKPMVEVVTCVKQLNQDLATSWDMYMN